MATVAGALAEAGQHEQAVTVTAEAETGARSITDPDQRAQTLAAVAEALAEAGEHEEAATAARSIVDPDLRARAPVAEALAEAGEHEEAATVARSITDPDGRARARVAVAEALAARGDTRQARHLASAACAVGRWTMVLGLVLSLEPSAVRVLADL